MNPAQFINKTLGIYKLGNIYIEPTYWQAAAIVFLLFLLVWTLARLRHLYVGWSFKAAGSMILIGFLFAVILEGFMILGGRTVLTGFLGWKNPPKPLGFILDAGRAKLVKVLGVTEEIPSSVAKENASYKSVVSDFQALSPKEADKARSFICKP